MKIRVQQVKTKISTQALAVMAIKPLVLGGYQLTTGGFVQVYSAILAYIPGGTPFRPAAGSQFTIRYGGATGPHAVDPLPAEGLIDQTEIAAGLFQPVSTLVRSAPLFLCLEGGAPLTVGDGSLNLLLTCHDPVMRVLDDDF